MTEEFTGVGNAFMNLLNQFFQILLNHWFLTLVIIFIFMFFVTNFRRRY